MVGTVNTRQGWPVLIQHGLMHTAQERQAT
ncbi:hypothetical protein SAMN05444921_114120 [Streptomyces wuyuanensis]|uniref:Uncharacterized protein n=1 Tax=Streptomyces wuyuanensis TaxID=1196353 RepID=A0A1G9WP00_9ACTN|nr:hypothetical protein SAMN05444921_114120 [Streptomyces wuyuanensis]